MRLQVRLLVLRAGWELRRANRQRRRQLAAELATYRSQSDRDELLALLDSYPDGMTHEIRDILRRQQS